MHDLIVGSCHVKKLKLNVEELSVESFQAAGQAETRGTVAAHGPPPTEYGADTCMGNENFTCVYHCTYAGETCFNQC